MARRETLASAIEQAQAQAVELDRLVVELQAKEKEVVASAKAERPGENAYAFGTAAEKARKGWRKAQEDRARLELELDALAVLRLQEIANEANEALDAAVKDLRGHRPALERLYAEAGAHVAALAALWPKVKAETEAFDGKVAAGRDLAPAAAIANPSAQAVWNEAAWSLSDLGPAPVNVAYFVEIVLAAGLDPQHEDDYRINAMRCDVGIPDLREFNVPAHFSGDRFVKRGGSGFADSIQAVAVRNEPKPALPPPTEEQLANAAVRAAEEERRFAALRVHEAERRRFNGAKPVWAVAPAVVLDADDPTGLGLSETEQRELAELQTR